jgi:flagellar hook-associated protein 1 FlgK
MLERVEGVFGEPSDLGLAAALDAFHSAWSALATDPGSSTLRSGVRQTAETLVSTFHRISEGLQFLREETETRLDSALGEASRLTSEIADLNRQITITESSGGTAGDLRDERARRLSSLAELLPIQVTERDDGSVGVATAGVNIVDGVVSQALESRVSGGVVGVAVVGRAGTLQLSGPGGSIGALVGLLNNDLPAVQAGLDDLASALVSDVNAIHATGTNPSGTTGVDFFDPAGVKGTTIALSAAVASSVNLIASGTPDGLGGYRAGANDVALGLAALRDEDSAALGTSFLDHFRGLVFNLGQAVRSSKDAAEVHGTLSHQADVRRHALGGVSIDEELVRMIEFQTAYQAAARVVTTVDEMLQTLVTV